MILIHPAAAAESRAARIRYAERAPAVARRFMDEYDRAIERVRDHPDRTQDGQHAPHTPEHPEPGCNSADNREPPGVEPCGSSQECMRQPVEISSVANTLQALPASRHQPAKTRYHSQ